MLSEEICTLDWAKTVLKTGGAVIIADCLVCDIPNACEAASVSGVCMDVEGEPLGARPLRLIPSPRKALPPPEFVVAISPLDKLDQ